MAAPTTVHFWFDLVSPYSYLAHHNLIHRVLPKFPHVSLKYHPIVFGAVLNHIGNVGPAEIPSKRIALYRDIHRAAKRSGIVLGQPKTHPFKSVDALRCTLAVPPSSQASVITGLFAAAWSHRFQTDLSVPSELRKALVEIVGNEEEAERVIAKSKSDEVKGILRESTEAAINAGIFGVPSFTFNNSDEILWGNDKIDVVEEILAGQDSLNQQDHEFIREVLKTEGITRKK
ncbi:HCCA isomerase/glutathione S-transferase kappa [Gonapodya prolifera JEL478]|uniref:Glutathione S-transferase kappa n=1 Tax=Gonapodya prolifera (strain JEL478) TaxID=1344416 RepID=A0A139AXL2_GONPJ|nr:HCCA isomerase/glutathione S-transferase kappa [Gonapodya prolifera JEL478]|eukprot:KXS21444.1 HCCA isomerase/glutathione S-transferase kappa [Gonapodya prolifera JEL478]